MIGKKDNIVIDDATLVRKCQQGDSFAMETLINKYQDKIFNLILKISSNYDDAAELTQETFVKVIESINGFRSKSSFYTWIYRIAVNLTLNHIKKKVRINLRSIDDTFDSVDNSAKGQLKSFLVDEKESDPASLVQNAEIKELIVSALSLLDDDQRAILLLREIESMSYADIAEILDIEIGTVKSRIFRARESLRMVFEGFID